MSRLRYLEMNTIFFFFDLTSTCLLWLGNTKTGFHAHVIKTFDLRKMLRWSQQQTKYHQKDCGLCSRKISNVPFKEIGISPGIQPLKTLEGDFFKTLWILFWSSKILIKCSSLCSQRWDFSDNFHTEWLLKNPFSFNFRLHDNLSNGSMAKKKRLDTPHFIF